MRYQKDDIVLSPFTDIDPWDDLKATKYIRWFENPEIVSLTSHGILPKTRADFEDYLKNNGNGYIVYKILMVNAMPYHVGNVSLQTINWINRSAELAIIIGEKSAHGKGIATFAVNTMLYHGFYKLGLHRIYTGTSSMNKAMRRVAEKCGFKEEGIFRKAKFIDGEYFDIHMYGILEHEFDNDEY